MAKVGVAGLSLFAWTLAGDFGFGAIGGGVLMTMAGCTGAGLDSELCC